jgi:hypothetical protein
VYCLLQSQEAPTNRRHQAKGIQDLAQAKRSEQALMQTLRQRPRRGAAQAANDIGSGASAAAGGNADGAEPIVVLQEEVVEREELVLIPTNGTAEQGLLGGLEVRRSGISATRVIACALLVKGKLHTSCCALVILLLPFPSTISCRGGGISMQRFIC